MAFCKSCGTPLAQEARFCTACGDAVAAPAPDSSIVVSKDGTYRWTYEFNLLTNPTILITVLKAFGLSVLIVIALELAFLVPDLVEGYADASDVLNALRFGGVICLLMLVLATVGYGIYALTQGGKYCVVFTMNEQGIEHRQLPRQFKKAQIISELNVLAGLATGNPSQVGIGLTTAARDSMYSTFSNVRSVKGMRRRRVIKVNEPLAKNQVYVDPSDYDFVFDYIRQRCPKATVSG